MKKLASALILIFLSGRAVASQGAGGTPYPHPEFLLIAVLAPFTASALIAVFYRYLGNLSAYLGVFSALVSLFSVFLLYGTNGVISYSWIPSLGVSIEFYVDGLPLLVATLASGIGALVFLYSRAYMEHGERKRKYYAVLTAFMGSMIGLVFSSNMILMFLFWEFTSICSFLLISHRQRTDSGIYASRKSLIITVGSGLLLLTGFLLIESVTGTFSIAELLETEGVISSLKSSGIYLSVIALVGVGAAAKSAQVPLHIWLPDAMEAPTPVSAYLHSATMVKAGVFLVARFRPVLVAGEAWNIFFLSLGLLTMTVAALLAVRASELKELLAYSTASHLGLITAGFGFSGVLGVETSTFHILNHALFKASLFMVAGVVLHEAGTQKIKELSGLRHDWPVLAAVATVSGLSMAGMPPLNGFYSKELLFKSAYHSATVTGGLAWMLPILTVVGSVFTFMYSMKFISVFYGEETVEQHEIPKLMIITPAMLTILVVAVGLVPNRFIDVLVNPALASAAVEAHGMKVHLPNKLTPAFAMSLLTIGLGVLGYRKQERIASAVDRVLKIRWLRPNFYYEKTLELSDRLSGSLVELAETSLLRTYATWLLVVASISGLSGFLISGAVPRPVVSATAPVLIVLATSVAAVYAILKADTYIASVLTLSILGFMVSIFYLLMDAPDLVMTQLAVESLSLIIFLLVLNRLPEYGKKVSVPRKFRDIAISATAGLLVFMSVLYSTAKETPEKLSRYYLNNALPGSGGTNVVNVILVDFRGLDTMGEISVIFMAGLAILMLFRMRGDEE